MSEENTTTTIYYVSILNINEVSNIFYIYVNIF